MFYPNNLAREGLMNSMNMVHLVVYSPPWTRLERGFPEPTLPVKVRILAAKTCLTFAFVTHQPYGIRSWNVDSWSFVASAISIFNHIVVSELVMALLPQ